MFGTGGLS